MTKKKSKGLGDTIEKITEVTGVKKATAFLFGKDCGCDERKEKLNKLYPYRKPECLLQKEYKFLDSMYLDNPRTLSEEDNKQLHSIYNRVFKDTKKATSCGSCVKGVMSELKVIYNEYKKDADTKA
tara:strand:+ start:193 stop:570 length:378 start_codon:yes stop_codon:yes gene_type:complete